MGAFGGRAEVMDVLAPLGPVYQAGTLSGNPLATAAGLATLDLLDDEAYAGLARRAARLGAGLADALRGAGVPADVPVCGTLVGLFFAEGTAIDYPSAQRTDEVRYATFFHEMLDRGIALAPGAYEVLFPGLAHDDAVIDHVIEVARAAAVAAAATSGADR